MYTKIQQRPHPCQTTYPSKRAEGDLQGGHVLRHSGLAALGERSKQRTVGHVRPEDSPRKRPQASLHRTKTKQEKKKDIFTVEGCRELDEGIKTKKQKNKTSKRYGGRMKRKKLISIIFGMPHAAVFLGGLSLMCARRSVRQ